LREHDGLTFQDACKLLGVKPNGGVNVDQTIQPAFPNKNFRKLSRDLAENYHQALLKEIVAVDYLKGRGIDTESIKRFKLGFYQKDGTRWLSIPHFQNGELVNIKFRNLNPDAKKSDRFKRMTGCKSILFNPDSLEGQKEVFICEGELDAITLTQAGFPGLTNLRISKKFIFVMTLTRPGKKERGL